MNCNAGSEDVSTDAPAGIAEMTTAEEQPRETMSPEWGDI